MKVIERPGMTIIHPFILANGAPNNSAKIIVWPDGAIMVSLGRPMMNTENARTLAESLLHAVEIAQNGGQSRET